MPNKNSNRVLPKKINQIQAVELTESDPNISLKPVEEIPAKESPQTSYQKKQFSFWKTLKDMFRDEEKYADKTNLANRSKFTIQVKMIGIITFIYVLSSSIIISIATYFFKTDSEVRIKEMNISMVELLSLKLQSDFDSILFAGRQAMINNMDNSQTKHSQDKFFEGFFKNYSDIVYISLYKNENTDLLIDQSFYNQEYISESKLKEDTFDTIFETYKNNFKKSLTGEIQILNVSSLVGKPMLAFSMPLENEKSVIVILIKMNKILSSFEKKGIATIFMVDREGFLLAHENKKLVLENQNLQSDPIVKFMKESAVNNGQKRYLDEKEEAYIGSYKKIPHLGIGILSTVSEMKAFEEVYNIQRRNILITVITLCFSIIVVFYFAKSISNPILRLLSSTYEIKKGNFHLSIKPTSRDEVGILTEHFIQMGEGLEEREKVKNILGSMIDPTVVVEAMKDLSALKRGSEKEITAFFSDVADFSTVSEQLKSAELASLLNEYLSPMTMILKKHNGVLDKYIGDSIVGIFNAPIEVQNHEISAARASVEMIAKLHELREYWTKNNLYTKEAQAMDIRIGLNSGMAKVGFMGTDALASYTMMGDTVNLAARLEAAGKDYGTNILVSEMINEKIKGEMFTRELDLVRVKGKHVPVKLFELIGTHNDVKPHIKEAAEIYKRGFELYLSQNWNDAINLFNQASRARGSKDKAAELLIDRCEYFKKSPPSESWDGVFTRKHK